MRALLDLELAAFLQGGVCMLLSSRDAKLRSSVTTGLGCRLSNDRREVTVLVSTHESTDVLADLQAGGPLAIVFSDPVTLRTVQLKAAGAVVEPCDAEDHALFERYAREVERELSRVQFGPPYPAAMLAHEPANLRRVRFQPTAAFNQTPGPRAGERLEAP